MWALRWLTWAGKWQVKTTYPHRAGRADRRAGYQPMREGASELAAVFESEVKTYIEGCTTVAREDLDTFYHDHPSTQKFSAADVKVVPGLKAGYIIWGYGAGAGIPTVLQQIGIAATVTARNSWSALISASFRWPALACAPTTRAMSCASMTPDS